MELSQTQFKKIVESMGIEGVCCILADIALEYANDPKTPQGKADDWQHISEVLCEIEEPK